MLRSGWEDICGSLRGWPLWFTLGNFDVVQRFRRTALGPLWVTLSFGILIAMLTVVYGQVLHMERRVYVPYLTAGLVAWNFIALVLQEASDAFIVEAPILWQTYIPRSACVFRVLWRNLLVLGLNALIFLLAAVFFRLHFTLSMFLAVPGLLLLCINLLWISLLLALVSVRFRDFPRLVALTLQLLLLLSPVIWRADATPKLRMLAQWDPLYHAIELLRSPLLGLSPSRSTWTISVCAALAGGAFTAYLFGRYRHRITYWL